MSTFTVEDIFRLVGEAIDPYFHSKTALVQNDDGTEIRVCLSDFVLRCLAEQIKERWISDKDNEKKVVESVVESIGYDSYVIPTGNLGGLLAITNSS
jgi:pyruvate/oxaloacetate carboxyltransferase